MNAVSPISRPDLTTSEEPMPIYDAEDLVGDDQRACIQLKNQTYFLRITRAGKLILTK